MAASDLVTALRQDAAGKTARPSTRDGDNAHVRSSIAIALRCREAVDDFSAFGHAADEARSVYVVATQSADGNIVLIGNVGHVDRGAILATRGRDATILDRRVFDVAGKCRHVQALATNRLHTCSCVMDGATAAHLAVVQVTTIQLTCDHATFEAGVRNDVEHVVRARHVQRAFHDHDVFECGVHGPAGDDAAAEVRPDIGILDQEVLDGCTAGLGEETGVAFRVKDVVGIFQAGDGMVLAIESAAKRKVFAAER